MKTIPLIIALSLLANAALAFKWWQSRSSSATPAVSAKAPAAQPATKPAASKAREPEPARVASVAAKPQPSAKPAWTQLFSAADLKGSILRLRAAGCPEETIQDLMVAEVTRRFADRRKVALAGISTQSETEYWKASDYSSPAAREGQKKYRELEREASALLVELLGFDPQKKLREESGYYDYYERQVSFVAPEKREQLRRYLEEFQEKEQDHYGRNRGLYDAQERAERREMQEEKKRGLAAFLTPEELRQWELRSSQMASQLQSEISTMSLTQAQYETLFALRSKVGDAMYLYGDQSEDPKARERSEQAKKQLQAEIKATLGDDLGKEWELSRTPFYSELFRLAKAENLPADTARKVFGYKEQAEAKAKEVRAMTDLSREQQQQTLAALRTETENAMKTTLGDKVFNSYKSRAYWLNSISYTPPVRPVAPKQP
ncbi:MAG: hypothetical protein HZA92_10560 [Verrucomicrobia bacterium]|nr:hypothetical protein [Verrucomicrobiota bacterium]